MAETFLSPIIEKLLDLLIDEAQSLKGVHKQVNSLRKELEILQPLLWDAEAKSSRGELSEATNVWLRQLRVEAERIEDVVDKHTYYADQNRQNEVGFIGSLRKPVREIKSLKTRHALASVIHEIQVSLQKIRHNGLKYGLRPFEQGSSSGGEGISRVDPRIRSLILEDYELVGIGTVSAELVTTLVEGSSERTVVSFVGEGGIGKTTLAVKVFKDVIEKGCFDIHVWVTVSQSYDIGKILNILMTKVCISREEISSDEEAFTLLRRSLATKRYVIVFDDVWQTDFWSVVKHAFPCNSNGSRILVTTRNTMVVESFKSESWKMVVKKIKTWAAEKAWELFCREAFRLSSCPPELENLSQEILSKCQGLPLAIVAVADLLSKKKLCKVEWERVLENLNWEFEEQRELSSVSKVLSLSYHDLPYHLKLCFLYFGVFPEDFFVQEERLRRIWIAEGFIELRKDKSLEQIAGEYMTELISRNLVSFELRFGSDRYCKVHDLIRDVIQKKASDLGFYQLFDKNKSRFETKSRRLIIHDNAENVLESVCDMKIRSIFLCNAGPLSVSALKNLFKTYHLLTLLAIEDSALEILPKEVGGLSCLKYLSLKNTGVRKLPNTIKALSKLKVLDLSGSSLIEVPIAIAKLGSLRHLLTSHNTVDGASADSAKGMKFKEGISALANLQTLATVDANLSGINVIQEMKMLNQLGSLRVSRLTFNLADALSACISEMAHLKSLHLESMKNETLDLQNVMNPPTKLEHLVLKGELRSIPNWISQLGNLLTMCLSLSILAEDPLPHLCLLPNLETLWLYRAYQGPRLNFKDGFRKLKLLVLREMSGLEEVEIADGAMPLLEELKIGPSPLLTELPAAISQLSYLKVLSFYDMPNEFVLRIQPGEGSEFLIIQHVPYVRFCYKNSAGRGYMSYELGEPDLLCRLNDGCSGEDTIGGRLLDSRLSFYCSDWEGDTDSTTCFRSENMSFRSDVYSRYSDDFEDC